MKTVEQQKTFAIELVKTVMALHGKLRGCGSVQECYQNELVLAEGRGAFKEIGQALSKQGNDSAGFDDEHLAGMFDEVTRNGQAETVDQVIGELFGKQAHENLLTAALRQCVQTETPAPHIVRGIAAALHYDRADDNGALSMQKRIQKDGIKAAAAEVFAMVGDETLLKQVVRDYYRLPMELEWQEKAQRAYELGFENEKTYKGCGQSVFAAVGDVLGIYDETTFRAATGLSGGLGLIGDAHCSALTGACLIAGILYPRRREFFNGDRESKYQCYDIVQKMHQHYLDQYGSVKCYEVHRNLMGRPFNLRDDVDKVEFEKAGAHEFACTGVVARASQWVVELIGEKKIEEELAKLAGELE